MATITKKTSQPLLGRVEAQISTHFEGSTPSRAEIRKQAAKALGEKEEHVIVKHIKTSFGNQEATADIAVYKNVEDARAVEHKSRMAKHEKKEESPAEKQEPAEQKEPVEKQEPAENKEE